MLCDLLVHVSGDESGRKRVALAAELAKRTGARLRGLHVKPPAAIPPLYKPSQIDAAVEQTASRLRVEGQSARAIFAVEAAKCLVKAHWFEAEGDVAKGISKNARFADLVILGQHEHQDPPQAHPLPVAHSVVLLCGRPVMVVPVGAQSIVPVKVAVAWDGSREAVRAVHDALPLLKLAQTVHVVAMVRPSDDPDDLGMNRLVAHLSNHGITADAVVERVEQSRERGRFRDIMANGGYDLVVMGAYSRPRWLEFVFGGMTVSTLLTSNVAVLVSH